MAATSLPELVNHRTAGNDAAIILVHGFGGRPEATFGDLPTFLTQRPELDGWDLMSLGYNTRMTPDPRGIWSADPSLRMLAGYLPNRVSPKPLARYHALAPPGHSTGGLLVQRARLDG